jgi:hypothetical protein
MDVRATLYVLFRVMRLYVFTVLLPVKAHKGGLGEGQQKSRNQEKK